MSAGVAGKAKEVDGGAFDTVSGVACETLREDGAAAGVVYWWLVVFVGFSSFIKILMKILCQVYSQLHIILCGTGECEGVSEVHDAKVGNGD